MKKRQQIQIDAWGYIAALVASIIGTAVRLYDTKIIPDDWWVGPALAVLFGGMAILKFRQWRRTSADQPAYGPPDNATNGEKIKYYQQLAIYTAIAITGMTLFTAWQLSECNSTSTCPDGLWDVAALLYWIGGRQFALWGLPIIGIVVIIGLRKKISGMKQIRN